MASINELVVRSDFDGVWNRPDVGSKQFAKNYHAFIIGAIGISKLTWNKVLEDAKATVRSEPEKHGWFIDGLNVTPVWADQYQENKAFAAESIRIINRSHIRTARRVPTENELPDFLNSAFQSAHSSIIAPPKPGAREAIKEIMRISDFGLVSNSETDNVRRGLRMIFRDDPDFADRIRVIGDAKKQKVNNEFASVVVNGRRVEIPVNLELKGTTRKPLLRRQQFIETLVKEKAGVFIEDVAEYLYPPLVIGLHAILLKTKRTKGFELDYIARHESNRGHVVEDLEGIVEQVKKIKRRMK